MPTTNTNVGAEWVKVADDASAEFLITFVAPVTIEIATTTTNTAPTVSGHRLGRESAITRGAIGPGFVWMRCTGDGMAADLVISK